MTITVAPARNELTANAGQTIFNYTFKIFSVTDLNVYITPAGQNANDSTDLTTAYTVLGVGDEDGGTITLTTGATLNDLITIVSNTPSSRTTDYQNNGDFRPDTVNADFDRVVSLVKKIEDSSNRSLLSPQSKQGPKPLSLPEPVVGELLRWNDTLSGLENISLNELPVGSFPVDRLALNYSTLAAWQADTSAQAGDVVTTQERVSTFGGGATGTVISGTGTVTGTNIVQHGTLPLSWVLKERSILFSSEWGAIRDKSTDNTAIIQAMIDSDQPTLLRNIFNDDGCFFELTALTFNNDVLIRYRANDEINPPSTIGQATNEEIFYKNNDNNLGDVNEWQFSAALHPGIILDMREDTLNRGAGVQAGLASFIIRKENINQWQIGRQTNGELAFTNHEFIYTLDLGTDDFTINPVTGDTVVGDTSGATGTINSIFTTSMAVSWDGGVFEVGETITAGGNVSNDTLSSISSGLTQRINRIVIQENGLGAGANVPSVNATAQWTVGGILALEDARGGVFGAAKAAVKIFDDLETPTIGIRTALNTANDTFEIFDDQGVLLLEIFMTTGEMRAAGPITSIGGGLTPKAFTTSQLADITNAVNTTGKSNGMMVYNLQTDRPIWASGTAAADVWKFADGTTAHTPV